MTTGERIREMREARGMTLDELARACGYKNRSTIHKYEQGVYTPKVTTITKIAKALNCDPDYLVFGDREEMIDEINELFDKLTPEQQEATLAFLRSLTAGRG